MNELLTKREWETFFTLIHKIVEAKGLGADEKAAAVRGKAEEMGGAFAMSFEEFTAWDFEPVEDDEDDDDDYDWEDDEDEIDDLTSERKRED